MGSSDKRQHARKSVALTGMLRAGNASASPGVGCEIMDISIGGARVRLAAPLAAAGAVTLEIEPFGSYAAEVAWADHLLLGLRFKESPDKMVDMITAIALHA